MKLKSWHSYIPILIGWLIVVEGLANILMAILPQFNLSLERILINYLDYIRFFEVQQLTNVLAVFVGIAFIILGRGLAKKQRSAWRFTIALLIFTVLNSLFPSIFLPTFIYTLLMLLVLFIFRDCFYIKSSQPLGTEQWVALISVALVLTYGIVGSYLLRDQYHGLNNWIDALYYSLETYTTIGYGDVIPITENARVFTCSMIIIGVSTFVVATGILLGPLFEKRLRGVFSMVNRLNNITAHVIFFGVNPMSLHTAHLLQAKGETVVFLSNDSVALSEAEQQGFRVILGGASKHEVLEKAQLLTANTLVCASASDADNLLVVMAAAALRNKNKAQFRIVTRVDEPEHMAFAKQAGADEVIAPAMLMGDSITRKLS